MAVPRGWEITATFNNTGQHFTNISAVRGICPHCRIATTFSVRASQGDVATPRADVYIIVKCNYAPCRKTSYIEATITAQPIVSVSQADDSFFVHPSVSVLPPHASVPTDIADDWLESQRSLAAGNPKATAVMLRRVLYSVLIDKGCPLHPLRDGMQQLITTQRLPAMFDEWLPAIRDDGHDGAHPDRSLKVSTENVTQTMEYTAELLRYLYIEPYEFQLRKARNTP